MMQVSRALFLLVTTLVSPGYSDNKDHCLRYGGGSCCPVLNGLDIGIQELIAMQPFYVVFVPRNEGTDNIDNICLTFFPLPDDSNTYLIYESKVNNNGFNEVVSFIVSQSGTGVRRSGKALCQFTDTLFAQVECDNAISLSQRCRTFGDCMSVDVFDATSGVFGLSNVQKPITRACLNQAEAVVRNNGLPEDDFYILPMRLPSKCVLNQVCSVASNLQRFCQTVGVAFPAINRCATPNLQ